MRSTFLRATALLALMASSTMALAETPARVGRVSLVQGQVSIAGEGGDGPTDALINWPVTTENRITTERGARTEVRVGSTAVRIDGDSSLEVVELDDDSLRLHLHYGSASVRIRNAEVLEGFELTTPHGRVGMRETGRIRVDSGRTPDSSTVDVFEGVAVVDSADSRLSVRAGRRAEMRRDDIATAYAVRTSFDDWALLRDQQDDRVTSDRYVTSEMTGYEDLDRYGSWSETIEYGPLWQPRGVSAGWAPYRDGRWTWVAPWGWTWIDNAPWGYAPFHYGRWVMVNQRWGWAPGRNIGRPVWAPALVGWVGGSGWSLSFDSGSLRGRAPAQGWYPLGPRDHYVPGYRASHDHLRHINRHARSDGDGRRGDGRRDERNRADRQRRHGLTVVPQDHFNRRVPVVVPQAPRAVLTPQALQGAPVVAPPAPHPALRDRQDRRAGDRQQAERDFRNRRQVQPAPLAVQPPAVMQAPQPPAAVQQQPRRDWNPMRDERRQERVEQDRQRDWQGVREERRGQREEARRERAPQPAPLAVPRPVQQVAPPQMAPRPMAPPVAMPAPAPAPAMAPPPQQREARPIQEYRRQQMEERRENRNKGVDVKLE